MHTLETSKVTFHYNTDLSGNVIICDENNHVEIPGEHLIEFVLETYIRPNLIDRMEGNVGGGDLVGWLWPE